MVQIEGQAEGGGGVRVVRSPAGDPWARPRTAPTDRPGRLRALLVSLDVVGAVVPWSVALSLAGKGTWTTRALAVAGLSALCLLLILAAKLYLARVCVVRATEISRLGAIATCCGLVAFWLAAAGVASSRAGALWGSAGMFVLQAALRGWYSAWLRANRSVGRYARRVCVLGSAEDAEVLVRLLEAHPELGYQVVAVVPTDSPAAQDDVVDLVRGYGASGVLIATTAMTSLDLNRVTKELLRAGIHVQLSTGLSRIGRQRLRVSPLSHEPMLYLEPITLPHWQQVAKRALDLVLGVPLLIASVPILLVAAFAIKCDDHGPVLFRQERVGREGRRFVVFKLRTMVTDADDRLRWLLHRNQRHGPLFKLADDPRVTRVGAFLRSTGIDEIPQLVNVLRGEMSLVGPRPALPREAELFDHELLERTSVRPGITGLWQLEARHNPSFDAYRRLDLFYIDNWSISMDVAIILGTARMICGRAVKVFLPVGRSATRTHELVTAPAGAISGLANVARTPAE